MDIFKVRAEKATCEARIVMILRQQAQAQRVLAEAQRVMTDTTLPPHKIPDQEKEGMPININNKIRGTPMVLQEDGNDDDDHI
jgi:hypothetical protein